MGIQYFLSSLPLSLSFLHTNYKKSQQKKKIHALLSKLILQKRYHELKPSAPASETVVLVWSKQWFSFGEFCAF